MDITQILAAVAVCLILYLVLKTVHPPFAVYVSVAVGLLLIGFIVHRLSGIFTFAQSLAQKASVDQKYFGVVMKCLGICYLGELTSGSCKECGQNGWADKVELACRCSLIVISIPIFEDFLGLIFDLLQ